MPLVSVDTDAVAPKGGTDIIKELKEKTGKRLGVPAENMLVVIKYGQAVSFGSKPGPVANVKVMSLVGLNGNSRIYCTN